MDFKSMLLNESGSTSGIFEDALDDFLNHKKDKVVLCSLSSKIGKKNEKIIEMKAERVKNGEVKISYEGILAPEDKVIKEEYLKSAFNSLFRPFNELKKGLDIFLPYINNLF